MKYSFNAFKNRNSMAFAQRYDVDASYKDLGAVCSAIRYMKAGRAMDLISKVMSMQLPIQYKRHNKHMGARHELHGRKGAYPVKAAEDVKVVLVNAMANARNNGLDADEMVIVHASSNKTHIERRQPSKGSIVWGRGMYGRSALMHSDIEYAKIEIALAEEWHEGISPAMKRLIERRNSHLRAAEKAKVPEAKPAEAKAALKGSGSGSGAAAKGAAEGEEGAKSKGGV